MHLLKEVSRAGFKPLYIEKIEAHLIKRILSDKSITNPGPMLIEYMKTYIFRRKVSQTQLAMCIKMVDHYFEALTEKSSEQRVYFRQVLFLLED